MKAVIIGESSGATMEKVMSVYPKRKAIYLIVKKQLITHLNMQHAIIFITTCIPKVQNGGLQYKTMAMGL